MGLRLRKVEHVPREDNSWARGRFRCSELRMARGELCMAVLAHTVSIPLSGSAPRTSLFPLNPWSSYENDATYGLVGKRSHVIRAWHIAAAPPLPWPWTQRWLGVALTLKPGWLGLLNTNQLQDTCWDYGQSDHFHRGLLRWWDTHVELPKSLRLKPTQRNAEQRGGRKQGPGLKPLIQVKCPRLWVHTFISFNTSSWPGFLSVHTTKWLSTNTEGQRRLQFLTIPVAHYQTT